MMIAVRIAWATVLGLLLLLTTPVLAQHASLEDMLSLDHAETPDHVANQAGTVLGTARVCEVDTTEFEGRVAQLLSHMSEGDTALDAARAEFATAARTAEEQGRSEPTIGCNDFRRLFGEFWINKPGWTPADGWRSL
jgi:hypothetical protein